MTVDATLSVRRKCGFAEVVFFSGLCTTLSCMTTMTLICSDTVVIHYFLHSIAINPRYTALKTSIAKGVGLALIKEVHYLR
jgi:hypothetical protein